MIGLWSCGRLAAICAIDASVGLLALGQHLLSKVAPGEAWSLISRHLWEASPTRCRALDFCHPASDRPGASGDYERRDLRDEGNGGCYRSEVSDVFSSRTPTVSDDTLQGAHRREGQAFECIPRLQDLIIT